MLLVSGTIGGGLKDFWNVLFFCQQDPTIEWTGQR